MDPDRPAGAGGRAPAGPGDRRALRDADLESPVAGAFDVEPRHHLEARAGAGHDPSCSGRGPLRQRGSATRGSRRSSSACRAPATPMDRPGPPLAADGAPRREGTVPDLSREESGGALRSWTGRAEPLYEARTPERVFESFDAIPPLIVGTLLFVENRDILDSGTAAPESGRRVAPPGQGDRVRSPRPVRPPGAADRREHPGHADREVPSLAGRPHALGPREAPADAVGESARLSGRHSHAWPRDGRSSWTISTRRRSRPRPVTARSSGWAMDCGPGTGWTSRRRAGCSPPMSPPSDPARAQAYKRVLSLLLADASPLPLPERGPGGARRVHRQLSSGAWPAPGSSTTTCATRRSDNRSASGRSALRLPRTGASARARTWSARGSRACWACRRSTISDRLDLTAQSTLDGRAQDAVSRTLQSLREPAVVRALGLEGLSPAGARRARPRDLQLHALRARAPAATSSASRPTTSTSRSTSTPAPGSIWARPPSCAR